MKTKKNASLLDALIPVAALITMLIASVYLYADDSSYGANQIALLLAASIAMLIGYKNGFSWKELEAGIVKGISLAMGAVLILLMVGSLIGSWILAGTVPSMIYYGMQLLEPNIFYAASCLICILVSLSIGSSWTTASTVGVALIGIAMGLQLSLPITAGAIISGAYFGDKMSPLSDTTNLAPAIAGSELFSHIQHMFWTTGPSILIALILFTLIGFGQADVDSSQQSLQTTLNAIEANFSVSLFSLLPLVLVLILAFKKMPAFPTLLIGALVGGIFAVFFQPVQTEKMVADAVYSCVLTQKNDHITACSVISIEQASEAAQTNIPKARLQFTVKDSLKDSQTHIIEAELADGDQSQILTIPPLTDNQQSLSMQFERRAYWINAIDAVWRVMVSGFQSSSGDPGLDSLLSRGGMQSMLNPTVWLIICAMVFGGVMEMTGLLQRLVASALSLVKGTGSLIITVLTTCIGVNIIAADQFIAIVLPGRMYRAEFAKRKLHAKNLSRSIEDSATLTSPLIPWNTCGAFMAGTLGVATFAYLPFCFFNWINPLVSATYGLLNIKIEKLTDETTTENPLASS